MSLVRGICAVVPVKETAHAKQRLAGALSAAQRQQLALAMLEDVLAALAAVPELASIMLVTIDPDAMHLAAKYGARVSTAGARDGHTGAIAAAINILSKESLALMEIPGDVPLITPQDIQNVMAARKPTPSFTIVPARDDKGSNAVLCSPAYAVPLTFGENSFLPHLTAARACGISPTTVRNARIGLDVDCRDDLMLFAATPSQTRTYALLRRWHIAMTAPTGTFAE